MPSLARRTRDARRIERELRDLAELIKTTRSPVVRRRLRVVALFVQGRLTAAQIAKRARVSRATAFVYWRCYRTAGPSGLLQMRTVGRPRGIPSFARARFDYLARPETFSGCERPFVYITEREERVFRVMGRPCKVGQISRWFRRYVQENGLVQRVRRFRILARGYRHLWWDDRLDGLGLLKPGISWARKLRADALLYASKIQSDCRSLYRRALAASLAVLVPKVAFYDEPHTRTNATIVWNGPAPLWPLALAQAR